MIQGGDNNTRDNATPRDLWGTGGPGYSIKPEFNDIPHKRGIVSMARSADPDSGGSQFFIVLNDSQFLDNQYTVFGRVIGGMDTVDKISSIQVNRNDQPINPEQYRINSVNIQEIK